VAQLLAGSTTVTFKYDPFGRRIQKGAPVTTNYLYDGANLLEEVDNGGNVLARYTHQMRVDEPLSEFRSSAGSYYQQDGLGSVTSLSNGSGTLANTYTFDSFGKLNASTGSLVNPFQYTGRESDQETGLDHYRARYYDQSIGRFISEDPIQFDAGFNFYAYVSNRPTMLTDPTGLAQCLYEVGKGTLTCVSSTDPFGNPQIQIDASSGLGGCKNASHCHLPYLGPIEPGKYQMNKDLRPGHEFWYRLEPIPHIPGWKVRLWLEVTVQAGRLGNSEAGLPRRRRDAIAAER
jgi:RHS repeat-associated protein